VEFLHSLPKDECRFAAYDLEFKTNDGINSSKLFFLSWLPDNAKIKMKTLYAAAKESVKQYLELNAKEITCTAIDDVNSLLFSTLRKALSSSSINDPLDLHILSDPKPSIPLKYTTLSILILYSIGNSFCLSHPTNI
jgi:hypothetical protein